MSMYDGGLSPGLAEHQRGTLQERPSIAPIAPLNPVKPALQERMLDEQVIASIVANANTLKELGERIKPFNILVDDPEVMHGGDYLNDTTSLMEYYLNKATNYAEALQIVEAVAQFFPNWAGLRSRVLDIGKAMILEQFKPHQPEGKVIAGREALAKERPRRQLPSLDKFGDYELDAGYGTPKEVAVGDRFLVQIGQRKFVRIRVYSDRFAWDLIDADSAAQAVKIRATQAGYANIKENLVIGRLEGKVLVDDQTVSRKALSLRLTDESGKLELMFLNLSSQKLPYQQYDVSQISQ